MGRAHDAVARALEAVQRAAGWPDVRASDPSRRREVVDLRHATLWVARQIEPRATLCDLGRELGGMHYSSVIYAIRRIDGLRRSGACEGPHIVAQWALTAIRDGPRRPEPRPDWHVDRQAVDDLIALSTKLVHLAHAIMDLAARVARSSRPASSQATSRCSVRGCPMPASSGGYCRGHMAIEADPAPFLRRA